MLSIHTVLSSCASNEDMSVNAPPPPSPVLLNDPPPPDIPEAFHIPTPPAPRTSPIRKKRVRKTGGRAPQRKHSEWKDWVNWGLVE